MADWKENLTSKTPDEFKEWCVTALASLVVAVVFVSLVVLTGWLIVRSFG